MKTLIELYDERPLLNVLCTEMFRPERTVFVCPPEVGNNKHMQEKMRAYFARRGVHCELIFKPASLLDASQVGKCLKELVEVYPDCAIDVAGGTDAALFASGALCAVSDTPAFTYSRKRNAFFDIHNAPFAHNLPCTVKLSVRDSFEIAGGSMRTGRVGDDIDIAKYMSLIDKLFNVYLRFRRDWPKIVNYMQRISQCPEGTAPQMHVEGAYTVKGDYGRRVYANEKALRAMEEAGLIADLRISGNDSVAFTFHDAVIRKWLRDVGSALEMYTYKACLDTGLFDDVRVSAIVDWNGGKVQKDSVTNELDVMCTRGVSTYFISCKTGSVQTEALNELAILRDRFGSKVARAAIVTCERGGSSASMRNRGRELEIDVIDLHDLQSGNLKACLKALTR
ncbi:MAG: DUF1887 family protein [Clostridia bacterium]|nr:DUF1887 family protein [Clostridia bacterium]